MTAKQYLNQAYRLDQRINSKLEQVLSLRDLTTKATATMSGMPGNASPNYHRTQDIIGKIIDLENDINADIDRLIDLKREMVTVIKAVEDPEFQTLLELPVAGQFKKSLDEYMDEQGVTGMYGVDTRALTRHIRKNG